VTEAKNIAENALRSERHRHPADTQSGEQRRGVKSHIFQRQQRDQRPECDLGEETEHAYRRGRPGIRLLLGSDLTREPVPDRQDRPERRLGDHRNHRQMFDEPVRLARDSDELHADEQGNHDQEPRLRPFEYAARTRKAARKSHRVPRREPAHALHPCAD
jgi:hypothetical protein